MNGYVTFSTPHIASFGRVFPLPSPSDTLAMIAPFWADMDGSALIGGQSEVFYHVYERRDPSLPVSPMTTFIMNRVQREVTIYTGASHFKPSLVVLVTWHNMKPWPQLFYQNKVSMSILRNVNVQYTTILRGRVYA